MLLVLRGIFAGILVAMLWVTTVASLDRGVFEAAAELWPDPWFRATLADAYLGFATFYVWVAYRERSLGARAIWLVLIAALGNIAMSVYVLRVLSRLEPGEPLDRALLRPS